MVIKHIHVCIYFWHYFKAPCVLKIIAYPLTSLCCEFNLGHSLNIQCIVLSTMLSQHSYSVDIQTHLTERDWLTLITFKPGDGVQRE